MRTAVRSAVRSTVAIGVRDVSCGAARTWNSGPGLARAVLGDRHKLRAARRLRGFAER